jgi:diguanylate cyclase (GGDEF)-like protein
MVYGREEVSLMERRVPEAERLSAALTELEDQYVWDNEATARLAREIEEQAATLGDERIVTRAQLVQANMLARRGELGVAARQVWRIHQWAIERSDNHVQARAHLVWGNIHRHLGDAAQSLEHSVLAVEFLDETATPHMRVWHRAKLADALGAAGSMVAARERYAETEQLAIELGQTRLILGMLNNHAYTEYAAAEHGRAKQIARRLQQLAERHSVTLEPSVMDTIGAIEIENGDYLSAERTLREAARLHHEGFNDDADALAEIMLTLARAQRMLGATERAQASLDESRELCVERGLADVLVRVHQEQSELHAARGEFAEAFAVHKTFFTAHNALHSSQREAKARTRQAMFETAEARREAERFREQARRDPLTGLRNRRYLDEQLPALIKAGGPLTVAIVDLDHFKRINDQLSHDVGDQVLVLVAKLLETELAAVSRDGFVARMGGEEFLMVLPGTEVPEAARKLDAVRRAIRFFDWKELTCGLPVTVSVGVAGRADAATPTQAGLLSAADANLYEAKRGGRDRVVCALGYGSAAYRSEASAA